MDPMYRSEHPSRPPSSRRPLVLALLLALLGMAFSAVSTVDFIEHLDRQEHAVHCSFIPGAGAAVESGCKAVMLSPYSSFFRQSLWGGLPVALWSLAVFAFLAWRTGLAAWRGHQERSESFFLVSAFGLPVLMSLSYAFLAMTKVDALCKVCAGIYLASFGGFAAAIWAWTQARPNAPQTLPKRIWVRGLLGGTALVLFLTFLYLAMAPKLPVKTCGELVREDDTAGVLLPLTVSGSKESTPAIEVLDPLCPSCRAFDERLAASNLSDRLDLKAVLFPLDSSCNWMVKQSVHPGACAVSEALLCSGSIDAKGSGKSGTSRERTLKILHWAFAHQEELRTLATENEASLRARIEREFPEVKDCLGGTLVKNKMTKSLNWAVANAIPVMTPQLFVGKSRVCGEDTDLGLEYTLSHLLETGGETARGGTR